jgi:hypothetical protein
MHSELIIQVKCRRELTYLRRDQPATTSQIFILFYFFNYYNIILANDKKLIPA